MEFGWIVTIKKCLPLEPVSLPIRDPHRLGLGPCGVNEEIDDRLDLHDSIVTSVRTENNPLIGLAPADRQQPAKRSPMIRFGTSF